MDGNALEVKKSSTIDKVPTHIAIIMDGNGRWAEQRGLSRSEGHAAGAVTVRAIVEESVRLGVKYLTLYSFSAENWNRPTEEVNALMRLFMQYLDSELPTLQKNGVRLRAVGDLKRLQPEIRAAFERVCEITKDGRNLDLLLAISYSSRYEILEAVRAIGVQVQAGILTPESISEELIQANLYAPDVPDPELLIRTSGEFRISNFLLWQLAYTEIVVSEKLWPEFREPDYHECLRCYAKRERRFGLTGTQIQSQATAKG